jgi:hypothetical protein
MLAEARMNVRRLSLLMPLLQLCHDIAKRPALRNERDHEVV